MFFGKIYKNFTSTGAYALTIDKIHQTRMTCMFDMDKTSIYPIARWWLNLVISNLHFFFFYFFHIWLAKVA